MLDKDRLGSAIAATVQAQGVTAGTPITGPQLETMWQAISDDIITEFKNNGVIKPTALLDSLSGAVTGTGTIE